MDSQTVWQAVLDAQRDAQAHAPQERGHRAESGTGGDLFDEVVRLDAEAVRLCRHNQQTRLRIGEALAALGPQGYQELGFSTLGAYAAERCSRSGRWAAETRMVAGRLAELPALRQALVCGELGWSMVELLCRHATPLTELALLEMARHQSVRAMRESFKEEDTDESDTRQTITVTLPVEEAWALEATRTPGGGPWFSPVDSRALRGRGPSRRSSTMLGIASARRNAPRPRIIPGLSVRKPGTPPHRAYGRPKRHLARIPTCRGPGDSASPG